MHTTASESIKKIRQIDFKKLGISEYNLLYIERLLPHLDYYFDIYIQSISSFSTPTPNQSWIVDFGGGHGFLSIFLKSLGYNVIYCDINPLSVETIQAIKKELNTGPDHIVLGSAAELKHFCDNNNIKPTHLIATDLIEHVFDLTVFFKDLRAINPHFEMVFTTASNPKNTYKCRQLRKYMKSQEIKYFSKRKEFISGQLPELSEAEVENLARLSRGETYSTIPQIVNQYKEDGILPEVLGDPYNTCDPENGNWAERILSFEEYEKLAAQTGFQISFAPGYYNTKRPNKLVSSGLQALNSIIRSNRKVGFSLAPYIVIKLSNNL